jgi:type I restriction enzyme S subunit
MINETIFDLFENVQVGFLVDSAKAVAGDIRLDSSHFVDDSNIVLNENIKFTTLSTFIDDVEEPKLFTRIYCDKEFGVPYISSSEMSEIEPPVNSRFISKTLTSNINQYIIKRGQVLVSAAGTVGSIVLATKELDGVAGTSDILRINVDEETNLGFVFTYLTSSFGANELANLAYGAIIKRVRGFQLAQLKTPIIDTKSKLKMNKLVLAALENRDEANDLLKKARLLVLEYNNLPELSEEGKEALFRETNLTEFTTDYRLDSHFYNPMAEEAVKNIQINSTDFRKLKDDITEKVFYLNRFTRTFVEKGFGIPYMAGKDIIKVRPTDVDYLSSTETYGLSEYKLKTGWILMTCSGTLGRTCFIYKNYENWVSTHDLIRIVSKDDFDSGYLYAFLSSDYGYYQALRYKHGAVIDHLTPEQVEEILIPLPSAKQQKQIGDLVRQAYDLRAEAIRLEDEAQTLLTQALTKE